MPDSTTADGRLQPVAGSGAHAQAAREGRTRRLRLFLMIVVPVVAVLGGLGWYFTGGRYISTDDAYVQANRFAVSTDVSGIVAEVNVHDNQAVAAGQVLFRLDDEPFRIALMQADARLGQARQDVEAMKAQYRQREQEIRLAAVDVDFAQRDLARRHALFNAHVVPQEQLDMAQRAVDSAQRRVDVARQQLAMIAADLGGGPDIVTDRHPKVLAALAAIREAQRDIDHCTVKAADDGVVSNVPSLRPGMYLAAGTPAFSLVATKNLWVEANPKESQLTYVRPGQAVEVSIDTYPGVTWQGHVASLSPAGGSDFSVLPAQNTSGNWVKVVQRIPIRVSIQADADKPILRSGMSAVIDIDTGHSRMPPALAHFLGRPQ